MGVTIHLELNGVDVPVVLDDEAIAAIAAALPQAPVTEEPEFYTVPQAIERYGWTRQRIYDLRSSGRLSRIGDGASVRVSRVEADTLIQNGCGR
jgi:hypothetical protein